MDIQALIREEVQKELQRLAENVQSLQPLVTEDDLDSYDDPWEDEDLDEEYVPEEEPVIDVSIVINSTSVIFVSDLGYITFLSNHQSFETATQVAFRFIDSGEIPKREWDDLEELADTSKAIIKWSDGRLSVEGNRIRFDGDLLPPSLEEHLLNLYRSGDQDALEIWTKFAANLREASHVDTHNRLHEFLKYNDLAINREGNVLAWKVVRSDFTDKHSGTFDNSVGTVVVMPRTKVTFDPNRTCSAGLHACAFEYLRYFGSRGDQLILVEIDVRDIVSVPTDYQGRKVRCCKYKVVHHVGTWGENGIGPDSDPLELLKKVLK